MKLEQLTDGGLLAELDRQRRTLRAALPGSPKAVAASRVIHHVNAEIERRAVEASGKHRVLALP